MVFWVRSGPVRGVGPLLVRIPVRGLGPHLVGYTFAPFEDFAEDAVLGCDAEFCECFSGGLACGCAGYPCVFEPV